MKTREFEALEVGDVVKYANERAEFVVIKKLSNGTYIVQCNRLAATPALWEQKRREKEGTN